MVDAPLRSPPVRVPQGIPKPRRRKPAVLQVEEGLEPARVPVEEVTEDAPGGIIEIELPSGAVLEFPQGTDPAVIQSTVKTAVESLRQPKASKRETTGDIVGEVIDRTGKAVSGVGHNLYNFVVGEQDPNEADTPGFSEFNPAINRAKPFALSDAAYGDVVKKNLGDRLIRTDKDAKGRPIVVYKDQISGEPRRAYINKPGLDMQDVDRFVMGALPYVAGAGAAGALTRGAGLFTRAGTQALAAGGVSLGQDAVASTQGSEQGFDPVRAGAAGILGGAATVLPLPVAATGLGATVGALSGDTVDESVAGGLLGGFTGLAAGRGLNAMLTKPSATTKHMADGKIVSPEAQAAAAKGGINPDELPPHIAEAFVKGLERNLTPDELAAQAQAGRFGIPLSRGQRTQNSAHLLDEKDARQGFVGEQARKYVADFDRAQDAAVQGAALSRTPSPTQIGRPDPYAQGVGELIAPGRAMTSPEAVRPNQLGHSIATGLRQARDAGDDAVNAAWKNADDIIPTQEGLNALPNRISQSVGDFPLDETSTPVAMNMVARLNDYINGRLKTGLELGEMSPQVLRSAARVRKHLFESYKGAATPTDQRAAKSIYDGYNSWLDDIADQGFMVGNPAAAAELRTARQITKDIRGLWKGTDKRGRLTPGSRILNDIVENVDNAEGVIAKLFGAQGPQSNAKPGAAEAIDRIRMALFKSPGGTEVEKEVARRTWNDMRMAYWSRLVIDKQGQMFSPTWMTKNISSAMRNQADLMSRMFTNTERAAMRDFALAMGRVAYKDPNPSGTASPLRELMKGDGFLEGAAKTFAQTAQKRETFAKRRFIMARFYQLLAKHIPADIFGTKQAAGMSAARRSFQQGAPAALPPTRSGLASSLSEQFADGLRE